MAKQHKMLKEEEEEMNSGVRDLDTRVILPLLLPLRWRVS